MTFDIWLRQETIVDKNTIIQRFSVFPVSKNFRLDAGSSSIGLWDVTRQIIGMNRCMIREK